MNSVALDVGKTPEQLAQYTDKLEEEFLINANDLSELTEAEWQYLKLPLGIVKRLKKLIRQGNCVPVLRQQEEQKGQQEERKGNGMDYPRI